MRDGERRRSLGKYHLIASLGRGGMANVYLALVAGPAAVNKLMVLKVLEHEVLHGPEGGLELFWDEARLAARLVHPNIVHTYEVGEIDGEYFLAMEYLDGQTYRTLRARTASERLPLLEDLRIISEVARGLHYAHELNDFQGKALGVVHRDVSPQNVFITYDGQVKLIDFGIAKTQDSSHETRVGVIKGKLTYMAPEQLRTDPLDGRADIFSLGAMLWEAVAGRSFGGGARVPEIAKVQARLQGEEPNIRAVQPDVAEQLAVIIDRALALDREQRWSDAGAMADALDAYIEARGGRPGPRSLASAMSKVFSEDRAAIHKLIDQHVQSLSRSSSAELPNISIGADVHTSSGMWIGSGAPNQATNSHVQFKPGAGSLAASTSLRRIVGVGVLGLGGLGLLLTLLYPRPAPVAPHAEPALPAAAPASVALPEPTPEPPRARTPEAPSNIRVRVDTTPADAQLLIDGVAVSAPFHGEFARGGALHRIEASAPGHQPLARLVAFDQDHTLSLVLERVVERSADGKRSGRSRAAAPQREPEAVTASQEARPVAEPTPAPPAAIVPGADIAPARNKVLDNSIDTDDPYATQRSRGTR